jgi:hypothetical protein
MEIIHFKEVIPTEADVELAPDSPKPTGAT